MRFTFVIFNKVLYGVNRFMGYIIISCIVNLLIFSLLPIFFSYFSGHGTEKQWIVRHTCIYLQSSSNRSRSW